MAISFKRESFPSLGLTEFTGKWNPVALEDLSSKEQEIMSTFLTLASPDGNANTDNVLLVKAGDGGLLKDLYGPSIFRKGDQLVVKTGDNEFPVTVSENGVELVVGSLTGPVVFGEAKKIKVKDGDGVETELDLYEGTLDLTDDSGEWEFKLRAVIDVKSGLTPGQLRAKMKQKNVETLLPFFSEAPVKGEGGGSGQQAVNVQDLGIGEFGFVGFRSVTTQYGERFILFLEDGRECWSKGNITLVLGDPELREGVQAYLNQGKAGTLAVKKITERADGKFMVDCAIFTRPPRALATAGTAPKTANIRTNAAAAGAAVADRLPTKSPTAVSDADIPF